jgi:hypothetical protein
MRRHVSVALLLATGLVGCCLKPTGEPVVPQALDGGFPDGGPSSDAGELTSCTIGGIKYASGAANPLNPCQSCQLAASTSDWTNLAAGTTCTGGGVCIEGACLQGCVSDGGYVEIGTLEPTGCRRCVPTASGGWTPVPDGTPCAFPYIEGVVCHAGSCDMGCFINGTFFASGSANPENSCQRCSIMSTSQWTTQLPRTPCADGDLCDPNGNCGPGSCTLGSMQVPNRASNPDDPSLCCNSILDAKGWSPRLMLAQSVAVPTSVGTMVTGEFDGDRWPDLAVLVYDGFAITGISILINQQGVLVQGNTYAVGAGTSSIATVDLNRDGLSDLVTSDVEAHTLSVRTARGDGTFYPPIDYRSDWPARSVGTGCFSLISGDFNGDGTPDVICGSSSLLLFPGDGDGGLLPFVEISPWGGAHVTAADFNGDGVPDLAMDTSPGTLGILIGNGSGEFLDGGSYYDATTEPGQSFSNITAGDVNNDGLLDVVVAIDSSSGIHAHSVGILYGLGNGSFGVLNNVPLSGNAGGFALADLEANGRTQLLIAASTLSGVRNGYPVYDPVLYQLNPAGGGSFQGVLWPDAGFFAQPLVGDFNNDGAQDIAASSFTGVAIYLNGCP